MKKGLSALLFVLMAAAMLVSNVMAAPAQSGRNVTLISTLYQRGGIVLSFHTTGLSKNDLRNISLTAHSKQWDVSCNFVDDTTDVRCVVTKKLSIFHGEKFYVTLAGFHFSGAVPRARTFLPRVTATPIVVDAPVTPETSLEVSISNQTEVSVGSTVPVATEIPNECSMGQILVYDFEWSGIAQSDGFIASSTIDPEHFGEAYSYYTTYTSDSILYYSYYILNSYAFTSSGSLPASQWDTYVQNMQNSGYSVEKIGEHCE